MKALFLTALLLVAASGFAQQSPHGRIAYACLDCHTTTSWAMRPDAGFRHEATGFSLAGQHRYLECASCHRDLTFTGAKRDCLSCHTDVHNSELGSDCLRCHAMTSWTVTDMRQKHQQTRFPLAGRHLAADCESCHGDASPRRFASTSPECVSCHRDEYAATMEPSHAAQRFSVDCAACHRLTAPEWKGSFDHAATAFPLTGAHRAVGCAECHAGNSFGKLPTDCFSCHEPDYALAAAPNHVTGGFSRDCLSCHTTAGWKPATYDHNQTGFALTGRHTATPCADCHTDGNYQLTYTDCYQCHQAEYASAIDPNHVVANFGRDCTPCHTTSAWTPSTFDHDGQFFRIYSGKHRDQWNACADCHDAPADYGVFTCISCHRHTPAETDGHHAGVRDYIYSRTSCYTCHRNV